MLHLAWRSLNLQAYKLNNLILYWFNILVEKIDFLRNCLTNDISYHVYMSKHLQDNLFHCWLKIYNDAIWLRKYPVGFTSLYLKFVFFLSPGSTTTWNQLCPVKAGKNNSLNSMRCCFTVILCVQLITILVSCWEGSIF